MFNYPGFGKYDYARCLIEIGLISRKFAIYTHKTENFLMTEISLTPFNLLPGGYLMTRLIKDL